MSRTCRRLTFARCATGACACGRTLPRLIGIEGRTDEILILPSGRALHPRVVWSVFKSRPEVLQYQLVQHTPERYEIRLKTTDRAAFDRLAPPITARLHELLGAPVVLDASFHERLDGDGPGKFRPIVSHKAKSRAE